MSPETISEILNVIAEMKQKALDAPTRANADRLAESIITQDCRPMVMVGPLDQWLGLSIGKQKLSAP